MQVSENSLAIFVSLFIVYDEDDKFERAVSSQHNVMLLSSLSYVYATYGEPSMLGKISILKPKIKVKKSLLNPCFPTSNRPNPL